MKNNHSTELSSLAAEFLAADFGDERLSKRLLRVASSAASSPDKGFPAQAGDDAALEATYRFLNNPKVSVELILAPHLRMTCQRVAAAGLTYAVHDTTDFQFCGEAARAGLTPVSGPGKRGFLGHFTLAVSADGSRTPLGLLSLRCWTRPASFRRATDRRQRLASPDNEHLRWGEQVTEVSERLGGTAQVIHVMDREADAYALLDLMVRQGDRFIVRAAQDRGLVAPDGGPTKLFPALAALPPVFERAVPLSKRGRQGKQPATVKRHPPRSTRLAKLCFSASPLTIQRPRGCEGAPCLQLNYVRVYEVETPEDVEPVEWRLITTEPSETVEQVLAIVDGYRTRWLIEEYFKALKTGCAFEKRQLESKDALLKALALFVPVAWRLLRLRALTREAPATPADQALTPTHLLMLQVLKRKNLVKSLRHVPLSETPTVQEALFAVAALAGHLKNNGPPGWQLLGRGLDQLLVMELGWNAHATLVSEM